MFACVKTTMIQYILIELKKLVNYNIFLDGITKRV